MVEQGEMTLAEVKELSENRDRRARELKKEGRKILGYICDYFPLEFLTAANIVPYRLMGDLKDPISAADTYVDPAVCTYVKSCFDMALKGKLDFLDGWVTPDACNNITNIYRVWNYNRPSSYSYMLNVPNFIDEDCLQFFGRELVFFRRNLEEFAECRITDEKLLQAIDLHNEQRVLMRELQGLKRPEPPLIRGSEMLMVLRLVMSLPVEEANELLRDVISAIKERKDVSHRSRCRLLIWGPEIDDPALFELCEDLGANVVADDTCIGTRFFSYSVEKTPDPLDGLKDYYLGKCYCPRIIRGKGEGWATYQQDLEDRFGHVARLAKDFSADGIIMAVMKWCDFHELDLPDLKEYLTGQGYPVLPLEIDYTMAAVGGLRTRIEAFTEMIVN